MNRLLMKMLDTCTVRELDTVIAYAQIREKVLRSSSAESNARSLVFSSVTTFDGDKLKLATSTSGASYLQDNSPWGKGEWHVVTRNNDGFRREYRVQAAATIAMLNAALTAYDAKNAEAEPKMFVVRNVENIEADGSAFYCMQESIFYKNFATLQDGKPALYRAHRSHVGNALFIDNMLKTPGLIMAVNDAIDTHNCKQRRRDLF